MMKRTGHYNNNNNNKNRFQQGGGGQGGGGHRNNYRKGGNHGNHNAQFNDHAQGDGDQVHPRQRRHLQAQKDRYVALAREALNRGDRILAEFYYQHVEHYSRMIGLIPVPQHQPRQHDQQNQTQSQGGETNEAGESDSHEGDDGAEETPLPTRYGGGPSSFYTQPAQNQAAPPPQAPEEDNETY